MHLFKGGPREVTYRMSERPWFTDPRIGTLPMPISVEGWISLGVFVTLILATALSHSPFMWPLRIVLGAGYFILSLVKSNRAK
jgi:hypothetical protein